MSDTRRKVAALMPLVERLNRSHCWIKTADGPRRISEALDDFKIAEHVAGRKAYGACPIAPGASTCRVACLDLDSHKGETPFDEMQSIAESIAFLLEQEGYAPHLYRSSGGHGVHIYLLWQDEQDAHSVREMLKRIIGVLGYTSGAGGVVRKQIECFPKQNEVNHGNFGSMFILPLAGKSEPLGDAGWQLSSDVPVCERPARVERQHIDTPELSRLASALAAIPNNGVHELEYDSWRNVVFGIHHATEGSDAGLDLCHVFSSRASKYDPEFLDNRVWPYIGVGSAEPITERSLFALAGQHGWQDPTIAYDFDVISDDTEVETPKGKARFQFIQAAAFSAGKPPGWIIKNVLPRAELIVMYGDSGSGKTFAYLDMLGSIARGVDWRGHKTMDGLSCGVVVAEGAAGFRSRLAAYEQHNSLKLDTLPLAVMAGAPNFMEKADIVDLGKSIIEYGRFDVLVVDTLAQVTAGANENSGEDMGRVIGHCKTLHKATGATIILIHHSGKDAARGARGWSGLRAAADAELEVTRNDADRVLTVTKSKDSTEGQQFAFRLLDVPLGMDDDGEVFGSCVVEHLAAPVGCGRSKMAPHGKTEVLVHKIALDLMDVGEAPSVTDVLTEYENRTPHDTHARRDTRRQVANRALQSLIDKGCLLLDGTRLHLPGAENDE